MTDEERKQLVNSLETYKGYDRELRKLVHDAAAEIRRLAEELQYQHACDRTQQLEIERLTVELDETRKRVALIKADREGWKFGRRYD